MNCVSIGIRTKSTRINEIDIYVYAKTKYPRHIRSVIKPKKTKIFLFQRSVPGCLLVHPICNSINDSILISEGLIYYHPPGYDLYSLFVPRTRVFGSWFSPLVFWQTCRSHPCRRQSSWSVGGGCLWWLNLGIPGRGKHTELLWATSTDTKFKNNFKEWTTLIPIQFHKFKQLDEKPDRYINIYVTRTYLDKQVLIF